MGCRRPGPASCLSMMFGMKYTDNRPIRHQSVGDAYAMRRPRPRRLDKVVTHSPSLRLLPYPPSPLLGSSETGFVSTNPPRQNRRCHRWRRRSDNSILIFPPHGSYRAAIPRNTRNGLKITSKLLPYLPARTLCGTRCRRGALPVGRRSEYI